jgi:hypothetical protein
MFMDNDRNREISTFRFGVIHDLVGNVELSPGEQDASSDRSAAGNG